MTEPLRRSAPPGLDRPWNRITLEHLWLGLPFFVILVKGFLVPVPLLDFWWHLKMGEVIVTSGSIPRNDIFSFTAAGKAFAVQNWLAEVLYYLVYRAGGLPLLVFFNAMLLVAALAPVYLLCREATSRTRIAVFGAFLAAFVFFCNMRPQVFSFGLLALFYWVLDGYRFQRRDKLWLLPFLTVLWVNLHGAFVIGLGLIALYLGTESVRRFSQPASDRLLSFSQLKKLGLVLVASSAATLLNPEAHRLYDYVRVVLADQASQQFVAEWQPPAITSLQGFLSFFGLFFLATILLVYARTKPDLTDLTLFLGFSVFGLSATRNTIWFGIIAGPVVARYLGAVDSTAALAGLRRFRLIELLTKPGTAATNSGMPVRRLNLVLAGAALFVLVIVSPWVHPGLYHTSLMEPQTPVGAADYIEQHSLRGNIFHPQGFGDYLIWRLYPKQRSFIDGRVHLFGESFVREYRLLFYDAHWEERLAPFDIRYLLLSKDAGQSDSGNIVDGARSSASWTVLYEDGVSVLFGRKEGARGGARPDEQRAPSPGRS